MLAQGLRFLEHADIQVGAIYLGEFGELDGACESRRSRAHDEDVELHTVAGTLGAILENQTVER